MFRVRTLNPHQADIAVKPQIGQLVVDRSGRMYRCIDNPGTRYIRAATLDGKDAGLLKLTEISIVAETVAPVEPKPPVEEDAESPSIMNQKKEERPSLESLDAEFSS